MPLPTSGYIDTSSQRDTLSRLVARRNETTQPPDEAAGCCYCLYDFDSVDTVAKKKPGAATAYMTVEEKKKEGKKSECMQLPRRWPGAKLLRG